ncbi:hypothetical protein CLAIMM_14323 [Cladophialophora immunda]|nr:hypothetical protein CLAIMM_14323 [Cladophialophora immunda]
MPSTTRLSYLSLEITFSLSLDYNKEDHLTRDYPQPWPRDCPEPRKTTGNIYNEAIWLEIVLERGSQHLQQGRPSAQDNICNEIVLPQPRNIDDLQHLPQP